MPPQAGSYGPGLTPPPPFPYPGYPSGSPYPPAQQHPGDVFDYPPDAYHPYPPGSHVPPPGLPPRPGVYEAGGHPAAPAPATGRPWWRKMLPIIAIAVVAAVAGAFLIYRHVQGGGECLVDGARFVTPATEALNEPAIHVPLTEGWTEFPGDFKTEAWLGDRRKTMRAYIINSGIRQDNYTPDIAVQVYDDQKSPEDLINRVFRGSEDITFTNRSSETVCGQTLYSADFVQADTFGRGPRPIIGTSVAVVVDGSDTTRWVAFASIATKYPDNPQYVAERDALLKGFHVTAP